MKEEFQTKDLYCASYIYAKSAPFVRVEREGKQCHFVFGNKSLCEQLQLEYFSRKGEVIGKQFADAIRTLKDLLFAD